MSETGIGIRKIKAGSYCIHKEQNKNLIVSYLSREKKGSNRIYQEGGKKLGRIVSRGSRN